MIFSYSVSISWSVSPVLFENMDFPTPSSDSIFNLLPPVNYSTLSTVHSMVLIYVSTWITRDKHSYWSVDIVILYILTGLNMTYTRV